MLNRLRSFAGSPFGAVVFIALILALLFFGLRGFGATSSVATVGSQTISQTEFLNAYNKQIQNMGVYITPSRAMDAQIPQGVLNNLIQLALLRHAQDAFGLGLSDTAVAAAVAADPYFQQSGQFQLSRLNAYLSSSGQTEAQLLATYRDNLLRNQIFTAVRGINPPLPLAYQRILGEYYGEQRTFDYAVLTPDILEPGPDPTEDDIQTYYDANPDKYQIGETRNVVLLELSPRVLADPAAVTDDEIAAAYEQQRLQAERRDVWQQVFSTRDAADAVQAQLDAGQTFDDLVAAGAITPIDLGPVSSTGLFDPAVAAAAFAMDEGGTQIITGRSGQTLVHVASISDGDLPPLEDMADALRQQIAESKVLDRLSSVANNIDEARDGGATLVEVGQSLGIPTRTLTLDANGNDQLGLPIADLPGGTALTTNIFDADIGTAPSPVPLTTPGAAVWYEVLSATPAHELALEDIHDRVAADWRADADHQRLQDLAQSVSDMLTAGLPTSMIAEQLGVTFQRSDPLPRNGTPPDMLTDASLQAAFNGPVGSVATIADAAGDGQVVQRVAEIITPDFDPAATPPDETTTATTDIADQAALDYILDLEGRIPITDNMDLVRQLIGAPAQ